MLVLPVPRKRHETKRVEILHCAECRGYRITVHAWKPEASTVTDAVVSIPQ